MNYSDPACAVGDLSAKASVPFEDTGPPCSTNINGTLAAQPDGGKPAYSFGPVERDGFYRLIEARRDMRHFISGATIDEAVLQRMLHATHCAPSVGLMQPWRLLRITDPGLRLNIYEMVDSERIATAEALGDRAADFMKLKVEGVRECSELLVMALPPDDGTKFGRRSMPEEMATCSLACAAENLWLAARVENIGMGWVSMFDPQALANLLHMPPGAHPLGIFCLGPVHSFYERPMLELEHWRQARPLRDMVATNYWDETLDCSTSAGDKPK